MVVRWKGIVCIAALVRLGGALAAESEDVAALVRTGETELQAAAIGVAGAEDRALAAFETALAAEPHHTRARAGRGLALIAQALTAPIAQKLPLARRGCAELDAAVAAAPDDPSIRLMRAISATKMPLLLERRAVAEADFAILLAAARDDRVTMPPNTRRGIFYHTAAWLLKDRRSGAIELLEQAAAVAAEEPTDEQVQSLLALARREARTSLSHADSRPPEKAPSPGP